MKNALYNIGYFIREARKIIELNWLANIFSFISTGLILFILAMAVTGWGVSNMLVETLQEEAEISVYLDQNIDTEEALELIETIGEIDGVWDARLVEQTEAYNRMAAILGEEARVLEMFEQNPFEAFIEVRISLDNMKMVVERLEGLMGIDYVRDNHEILSQVQNITRVLKNYGYLLFAAVGISTLVIISHMIRQGIYNNRLQISTLRLLGAPERFIGFPFVLAGLLLTLAGGILASILIVFSINRLYSYMGGVLPFIPLPPSTQLVWGLSLLLLCISIFLGVIGSLFGLSSTK